MKRPLFDEKEHSSAIAHSMLLRGVLGTLGPWKWLPMALAIALGIVAFAWSRPAARPIWSGTASIEIGKTAPIEAIAALLTRNTLVQARELVESADDVIWRTNTNRFRKAVFASAGLDELKNAADWKLFVSTFRAIRVSNGLLRVELSATSPHAAGALLQSAIADILDHEAAVEKQRTALIDRFADSYTRRLDRIENASISNRMPSQATETAGTSQPGLTQQTSTVRTFPYSRGTSELFATREGLLLLKSTQIPTSVLDPPKVVQSGHLIAPLFLSVFAGLGTLAAALVLTTLVLTVGRDRRANGPSAAS